MDFVKDLMYYTRESEAPMKYFYWSALSSIAAVMRRAVWLPRGMSKLYPNIYVILVGRSGLRKSSPISLARHLVENVNTTRVYAGRISIQGVISDLAKMKTREKEDAPIITGANGYLTASEFASFIIRDPDAMTIMTDLYDSHYYENSPWVYMLRNSPAETLKDPYINLLGASNEVHLKDVIPDNAIGGGFIARTCLVVADKKAQSNSLMGESSNGMPISALITSLHEISKYKGPFSMEKPAADLYDSWYQQLQGRLDDPENHDETGTMERLHDHVLKVAMLLCLGRGDGLTIKVDVVKEAIHACTELVSNARKLQLSQFGKAASATGTAIVLKLLTSLPEHEASKSYILQRYWSHFSAPELDGIAESLFAQKAIQIVLRRDPVDNKPETYYVLNRQILERIAKP